MGRIYGIFQWSIVLGILLLPHWGQSSDWVEKDFPFFTMTVDGRNMNSTDWAYSTNNVTVRGIIFPLSPKVWACFDTDLLRWSLSWSPKEDEHFIQLTGMAPQSYKFQGKKTPAGQKGLSKPIGMPISSLGIFEGFALGGEHFHDPRKTTGSINEPGSGPTLPTRGRWIETKDLGKNASIKYRILNSTITEYPIPYGDGWVRLIKVNKTSEKIRLGISQSAKDINEGSLPFHLIASHPQIKLTQDDQRIISISIPAGLKNISLAAFHSAKPIEEDNLPSIENFQNSISDPANPRLSWNESLESGVIKSERNDFASIKSFEIPKNLGSLREIRPTDIAIKDIDTAYVVTFDGDLWKVTGLKTHQNLIWKRVASGLHEPQSIAIKNDNLFSFTRNGLIKLNNPRGSDRFIGYKNYNNQFAQSTETREFPMDMVVDHKGHFYLAKGGQQGSTPGIHNGSILKIVNRKKPATVYARGLRQAYLGYHEKGDWISASDQQGNWVPSTPLLRIERNGFYGHKTKFEREPTPDRINEPLLWMPHKVLQSGAGQIYLKNNSFMAGKMIYLDFFRSQLAIPYFDNDENPSQAGFSVIPIPLDGPILKGEENSDGSLWMTGMKIWGSNSDEWASLCRVQFHSYPDSIPYSGKALKNGILLEFSNPIQEDEPMSFAMRKWNYKRTASYGSGYFNSKDEPGFDLVNFQKLFLSKDKKKLFFAMDDVLPIHQIELNYSLSIFKSETKPISGQIYFTVNQQNEVQDISQFDPIQDVWNSKKAQIDSSKASVVSGKKTYESFGCLACHSIDGTTKGRSGPTLKNLWMSERKFSNSKKRIADKQYLRDSVLYPTRNVLAGYDTNDIGMPSYQGILTDGQIESLVLFIQSLSEKNDIRN